MKIRKFPWKTYKEALAWNYDKGLDEQSVADMSEMILKGMQDAGMTCQRRYSKSSSSDCYETETYRRADIADLQKSMI